MLLILVVIEKKEDDNEEDWGNVNFVARYRHNILSFRWESVGDCCKLQRCSLLDVVNSTPAGHN